MNALYSAAYRRVFRLVNMSERKNYDFESSRPYPGNRICYTFIDDSFLVVNTQGKVDLYYRNQNGELMAYIKDDMFWTSGKISQQQLSNYCKTVEETLRFNGHINSSKQVKNLRHKLADEKLEEIVEKPEKKAHKGLFNFGRHASS